MSWDNRVIWSEGTFLQPQHLQQHDRFLEAYVELRTRVLRPHSWGFLEVTLDESLLELGKLAVRSIRGTLPDGTPFDSRRDRRRRHWTSLPRGIRCDGSPPVDSWSR
jgi:type VI secretion system protein ImpJ